MKNAVWMFGVLLCLAACEGDDPIPEMTGSYLPLSIGNYWNFRGVGWVGDHPTEHREVVDNVNINGKQYYLLTSTSLQPSGPVYKDSAYYRVDEDGFVYVYRKSTGIEENRYRLNGKDGDTWTYDYSYQSVATMTLKELSKDIGDAQVPDCKDYSFDIEQWADEEYTYTLAPGVGFLKEFSDAWGGGQVLMSAKIDGKIIEY